MGHLPRIPSFALLNMHTTCLCQRLHRHSPFGQELVKITLLRGSILFDLRLDTAFCYKVNIMQLDMASAPALLITVA